MKHKFCVTIAIFASTALSSLVHRHPRGNSTNALQKRDDYTTANWAGAAIKSPEAGSSFSTVVGTFVVPTIDTATMTPGTAVSLWVGIDGYYPETPPVIQAGVDVEYTERGDEVYSAWWEWVDASDEYDADGPQETDYEVTGGDTVTVQVSGTAGTSSATASFIINGKPQEPVIEMFPGDGPDNKIEGRNIEWIIERLQLGLAGHSGAATLLNFGTITLTDCAGTSAEGKDYWPQDGDVIAMAGPDGSGISASTELVANDLYTDNVVITWRMA